MATHASEGLLAKKYYLLGNKIQKSFSPLLHNTGFKELGLPHTYGLFEVPEVDASVKQLLKDDKLGGLSITAPHKLQILPLLDTVSEDARIMGSVNTVIVTNSQTGERSLHGENTDWQGISRCITRGLTTKSSNLTGVVVGAGGAARAAVFAMIKLEIPVIYVVNRTLERARALAATFPGHDVRVVGSIKELVESTSVAFSVIVGCIPADALQEDDIPASIFVRADHGVLVEMAYHTQSSLVTVAQKSPGWNVFDGIDVLQQQAYSQFKMWTGSPAPESVMNRAVNTALQRPGNPLLQ